MSNKGWAAHGHGSTMSLARAYVRQYAPYLTSTLYAFVPTPVEGLTQLAGGPLAVTDRLVLLFDPEWVASVDVEELAFGLSHEVYHDQLRHVRRSAAYPDKRRWNHAGDLFINGMMNKQKRRTKTGEVPLWNIPDWVYMPSKFGFPDGLTADEYYKLLEQTKDKHPPPPPPGSSSVGCGTCGGIAGNPLGDAIEQQYNEQKGRSEADCKSIARSTSKAIQEYMLGPGRGTSPGDWSAFFDMSEETYVVPWPRLLANTMRVSINNARMGGFDYSMRRPSPRSYLRGIPLPSLISYEPEIAFLVDSSGSMGEGQIGTALRICSDVLRQTGIRTAWFMEVDAATQRKPTRVKAQDLRHMEIKGGGGTNFTPGIEYMQQFRPQISTLFYLTDGDGTAPKMEPKEFKTVWCVVPSTWARRPAEWGTLVVLGETQELRPVA